MDKKKETEDLKAKAAAEAAAADAAAKKAADEETDDTDSADEEGTSILEAKAAAAEMKKQNDRMEALVVRAEKAAVVNTLSGRARAGTQEQTKEQKEILLARSILSGTGYEDSLFPLAK